MIIVIIVNDKYDYDSIKGLFKIYSIDPYVPSTHLKVPLIFEE
jgi:hypothetical protein